MRKIVIILTCCFLMTSVGANVRSDKPIVRASEDIPIGKDGQLISLQELSVISMHDMQKLTGEKMSLSEKISFKAAQRQLRQSIHRDGTLDKNFGHWMMAGDPLGRAGPRIFSVSNRRLNRLPHQGGR